MLLLLLLLVIAIVQFFITRHAAGNVIEEGRAERLWMLYPFNVVMNAAIWTVLLTAVASGIRLVRRAL